MQQVLLSSLLLSFLFSFSWLEQQRRDLRVQVVLQEKGTLDVAKSPLVAVTRRAWEPQMAQE